MTVNSLECAVLIYWLSGPDVTLHYPQPQVANCMKENLPSREN